MRFVLVVISAAALCSSTSAAFAQQSGNGQRDPWEKWSVSLGAFVADLDNSIRIGAPGVGLEFDLEDALGLKNSQTVFRLDASYRFGADNRHRLDATWFDLSRSATRTLLEEIEIGGVVYPIGTTVDSEFDLAFYNVRYGYSFIKDERIDFAGSLGLHITDVGMFINDTAGILGEEGDRVTAPLPLIGMRLDVALTPNWYFRSSVEALYLSLGDFTGSITDTLLAGEYRAWDRFALGVGLNAVHLTLENDNALGLDFKGRIKSDFVGLMLYGKAMF